MQGYNTKALVLEFGQHKINVNAIAPGGIQTPGGQAQSAAILSAANMPSEELTKGFTARIALGRMGSLMILLKRFSSWQVPPQTI